MEAQFGAFTVLLFANSIAVAAFAPGKLGGLKHMLTPILTGIILDIVYRMYGSERDCRVLIPTVSILSWYLMLVLIEVTTIC